MFCFTILFHVFPDESASEINAKLMKNRCQNDALKISKIDAKMAPKIIVDAERHRRTPRPLAISGKTIYVRMLGLFQTDPMRDAGRNWPHWRLK